MGASGGILTAWNNNKFHLKQSLFRDRSVSAQFDCCASSLTFWVTIDNFFQELFDLQQIVTGPWIIAGDFNTIRSADDRNSGRVTTTETLRFNNWLHDMQVQELPLLDRNFTWSNMQSTPILTRIDRVFFNTD
ncbi:hypothetical protein BRADI_4g40051v3 [Brachypodium distachyon]|uniref:Endonuclease/exonuclease/phosphatase domain-containing protein n=1 Tax=Brachypodium distachyon TaxID=15368 RepID=A0A2K2CTE5_BRADI|nr:hypothetical protein BRADI_4g40051v3 [Brachypodium distachyon]